MNPKIKMIFLLILIIVLVIGLYFVYNRNCRNDCEIAPELYNNNAAISENIEVVPTMNDQIAGDTAWCGTFQLVWNDMINGVVKQDVKFANETPQMVYNLNKQDFNEKSISEEYYYKKFGFKTLDLKNEIEKGIKEKFNETSDVLNDLDWNEDALDKGDSDLRRYIFYTMLKREFSYEKEFTKLENDKFANQYDNVKYFGIDDSTEDDVRKQVDVLYYTSEDDCAVVLNTIEGNKVVLCKGINGTTFYEVYDAMIEKSEKYRGKTTFEKLDYLKVPEISFNIKKEYTELEEKDFETANGNTATIIKAIQSIQMNLDEKGGSVKSEAILDMVEKAAIVMPEEPRYFNFDDKYTVFIIEQGKDNPYFATSVTDITKFQ